MIGKQERTWERRLAERPGNRAWTHVPDGMEQSLRLWLRCICGNRRNFASSAWFYGSYEPCPQMQEQIGYTLILIGKSRIEA